MSYINIVLGFELRLVFKLIRSMISVRFGIRVTIKVRRIGLGIGKV